MSKAGIHKRIDELIELMREEQKLRVELLSLEMLGSNAVVRKSAERHDEILAEINEIRLGKMVPIFREFAQVIKHRAPAANPEG